MSHVGRFQKSVFFFISVFGEGENLMHSVFPSRDKSYVGHGLI